MREGLAATVLLTLITGAHLAGAPANDAAEFKMLIQHYWEAWSTLKPDNAAPMYAKDADAVFFDIAPMKYNGWEDYKAGIQKVAANWASVAIAPNDDLKATRRGSVAWTSNTFHGTITLKDGKTMPLAGRHTAIWEKRGGHWLIVHEHVSVPLPE